MFWNQLDLATCCLQAKDFPSIKPHLWVHFGSIRNVSTWWNLKPGRCLVKISLTREARTRDPKFGSRKRGIGDIEVQDNEMISREMSTKWPRDCGICSRYWAFEISKVNCMLFFESPVFRNKINIYWRLLSTDSFINFR